MKMNNVYCKNCIYDIQNTEVKRGKWILEGINKCFAICSECGVELVIDKDYHPRYCKECGADMRGEHND